MKPTKTTTILVSAFFFFSIGPKIADAKAGVLEVFAYYYYKNEKINQSIEEYKKILNKDPANSKAHYNLGVIYTEEERYELAIREFELVVKADSLIKKDALHNLIIIYKKYLNDTTNAYKYYQKLKKITAKR